MTRRPWTPENLTELEALWRAGKLSTPQIAERIGRTPYSIKSVMRENRARFPRRYVKSPGYAQLYVSLSRGLQQRVDYTGQANGINRSLLMRTLIQVAMDDGPVREKAIHLATHRKTREI